MQILKYTDKLQKLLGCKTKPEPWMHIAIKRGIFKGSVSHGAQASFGWVIYVWDTRKILEAGNSRLALSVKYIKGMPAIDNKAPLQGQGAEHWNAQYFNAKQ